MVIDQILNQIEKGHQEMAKAIVRLRDMKEYGLTDDSKVKKSIGNAQVIFDGVEDYRSYSSIEDDSQ